MRIHLFPSVFPFLIVSCVLLLAGCPGGGRNNGFPVCGDDLCEPAEGCDCPECSFAPKCATCVTDSVCAVGEGCDCVDCQGDPSCECVDDEVCASGESCACEDCDEEPRCDEIDPVTTANVLGYVEVRIDHQGTGAPSSVGAIQVVEAATPAVERDKLRSQALAGLRGSAVGECISVPRLDSPTAQRIVYATGPVMPRTGGGTALTFSTMGFLQTQAEAGASYDLLVAPQTDFGGVSGPGLIKVPPPVSSLVAGSPTPSGWDLGRFPPGSALPTMTWGDAPSGPASDILVRIFDPRNGATGGPTLTDCRVAPTATSWTMPQAIYDALDTTDPATSFDRITISLTFANVEMAAVTGSTTDEQILVTSLWKEGQISMTKPAN